MVGIPSGIVGCGLVCYCSLCVIELAGFDIVRRGCAILIVLF